MIRRGIEMHLVSLYSIWMIIYTFYIIYLGHQYLPGMTRKWSPLAALNIDEERVGTIWRVQMKPSIKPMYFKIQTYWMLQSSMIEFWFTLLVLQMYYNSYDYGEKCQLAMFGCCTGTSRISFSNNDSEVELAIVGVQYHTRHACFCLG